MRHLAVVLALLIGFSSAGLRPANAQQAPGVLIAWDATNHVSCTLQIQKGKGPWTQITCPAGSVIAVSPTTSDGALSWAESYQSSRTVERTGDEAKDNANADLLVSELRADIRATSGGVSALGGCDGERRNVSGSYVVSVGSTAARTYYALGYTVAVSCDVTAVRDRGKVGPSNSGRVLWLESCSRGSAQCSFRGITLTGNWTSILDVPSSVEGNEYRHISRLTPCAACTRYYGLWSFD